MTEFKLYRDTFRAPGVTFYSSILYNLKKAWAKLSDEEQKIVSVNSGMSSLDILNKLCGLDNITIVEVGTLAGAMGYELSFSMKMVDNIL